MFIGACNEYSLSRLTLPHWDWQRYHVQPGCGFMIGCAYTLWDAVVQGGGL